MNLEIFYFCFFIIISLYMFKGTDITPVSAFKIISLSARSSETVSEMWRSLPLLQ